MTSAALAKAINAAMTRVLRSVLMASIRLPSILFRRIAHLVAPTDDLDHRVSRSRTAVLTDLAETLGFFRSSEIEPCQNLFENHAAARF